jgi:hypothetical protein
MRTRQRVILFVATLLVATYAQAQLTKKLPLTVQREIAEMEKICREAGGKPANSPGLLTVTDLTGDGLPDFVIDQGVFNCEGAVSLFAGSGGSQMSVYVGDSTGQASKVFDSGSFGIKIDKTQTPAKVLVMVGGHMCGQEMTATTPRSDLKSCWRSVDWNEKTKKMQFVPVPQVLQIQ